MPNELRMSKPTLFIGSSTESKWIIHKLKSLMEEYFDVRPWDEDIFHVGSTVLEDLHREILLSDYALLILYPDDEIIKRTETGYVTRDNILFELGLFMGVLGQKRSFWLAITDKRDGANKVAITLSDLYGLQHFKLTLVDDKDIEESNFKILCNDIKEHIMREESNLMFTILPSTSLAIGYYRNFVYQACKALLKTSNYKFRDKYYDFTRSKFILKVVLPDKGSDIGYDGYYNFLNKMGFDSKKDQIIVQGESRNFPFFIDSVPKNGRILLYDYPTTLMASIDSIKYMIPYQNTSRSERERIQNREIVNFERTLRRLLDENQDASSFRDNVQIVYLSQEITHLG